MIETTLTRIADALESIANSLARTGGEVPAPVTTAPVVAAAPVAPAPVAAPVAAPAPAPQVVTPEPVVMPPLPTDCPITDQQSLVQYVMSSYKAMGPVKGNMIQGVLAAQGIANINEAKPEQFAAIHAGIEALKAQ